MSLSYAVEKFMVARHTLAIGPGRIQGRLKDAWVYSLINIQAERDIPDPDLLQEFQEHHTRMTSGTPQGDEGTIAASAHDLDDDDAMAEARWILEFLHRLEGLEEEMAQQRNAN